MSSGSSQIDPQEIDERNASTPNTVSEVITPAPPVVSSNDRSTGTRRRGRRTIRGRRATPMQRYVNVNRGLFNYSDQDSVNNHYHPYVIPHRGRNRGPEVNPNVTQQVEGSRVTLQLRILDIDIRNVNNVISIDIGAPEGSSATFVATLTANNNMTNNNETSNNITSNENIANNENNTNNENAPVNGDNAQDASIDRGQNDNAQDASIDRGQNDNAQDASVDRGQNTSP